MYIGGIKVDCFEMPWQHFDADERGRQEKHLKRVRGVFTVGLTPTLN
jgi:hypothetical protein